MAEVQALCGDPHASVSPLLCLAQIPSAIFLQPIKVQVPLPPGVTGTIRSVYAFIKMHVGIRSGNMYDHI